MATKPPKFYKPEPGEIEEAERNQDSVPFLKSSLGRFAEVVQADPEDKKKFPGKYREWRFEVNRPATSGLAATWCPICRSCSPSTAPRLQNVRDR